ncbi:unnamed protein product [Allacma fusca]|uniref:tRNA (adenine(58)-N(1))-methyltransferase non-catalytic subunit TRM6 n=1 Tax=Allacma fusca TaxID=39272 RepID=A0A8J2JKW1_9HEXA|nr:unnamed protein product [Allacma fusca]
MYVLVQRGDQERVIEFKATDTINYGKGSTQQSVELRNASGMPNYTKFKVTLRENTGTEKQIKYNLVPLEDDDKLSISADLVGKGKDNRDIFDDNKAQKMNAHDIRELREKGASSSEILETLISNSSSFNKKTEYSQEKYLKKKEKMYGDTVTLIKPTLSILADYYFKKDPAKILNIRADTLSQILSYGNVHARGKYIVYETGCSGLVVAAVLSRLSGEGLALHVHPGSSPQRQAVNLMNFTSKELQPLRSLDVFYLVRQPITSKAEDEIESEPSTESSTDQPLIKKTKLDDCSDENSQTFPAKAPATVNRLENEKSLAILQSTKFFGLLIMGKEHPLSILQRLLPSLSPSAPFVVYSQLAEPLGECYMWLKEKNLAVNIHLAENWCRNIQVETERTHPEINMSGTGGYFLTGTAIC